MEVWKPNYQDFQEMFANDYSLKILTIISQKSQNNDFPCANDIAKILDIHISTTTKYLDLLCKNKLIKKEQVLYKPGKPTYYKTKLTSITVTLDLTSTNRTVQKQLKNSLLENVFIREKPNLPPRVIYKLNDEGTVKSILIKKNTKAKRIVAQEISLSSAESQFMKLIPYPTMKAVSYLDICSQAGINDAYTAKEIEFFVKKLQKYEIIEVFSEGRPIE